MMTVFVHADPGAKRAVTTARNGPAAFTSAAERSIEIVSFAAIERLDVDHSKSETALD